MMVARPEGQAQIVWKHPDETIPMKSQLTVDSDEVAVFFRAAVVETKARRYTLDSSNLRSSPTWWIRSPAGTCSRRRCSS